jgi:excisionase family DNA binding protein
MMARAALDPREPDAMAPAPDLDASFSSSVALQASPGAQIALTVGQVAALLGMTPKAVYHRAERGQLPGLFRVGRSLRFRRADLIRFVSEGRGLSPTRSR